MNFTRFAFLLFRATDKQSNSKQKSAHIFDSYSLSDVSKIYREHINKAGQ